jgi:hypothetical protein
MHALCGRQRENTTFINLLCSAAINIMSNIYAGKGCNIQYNIVNIGIVVHWVACAFRCARRIVYRGQVKV